MAITTVVSQFSWGYFGKCVICLSYCHMNNTNLSKFELFSPAFRNKCQKESSLSIRPTFSAQRKKKQKNHMKETRVFCIPNESTEAAQHDWSINYEVQKRFKHPHFPQIRQEKSGNLEDGSKGDLHRSRLWLGDVCKLFTGNHNMGALELAATCSLSLSTSVSYR